MGLFVIPLTIVLSVPISFICGFFFPCAALKYSTAVPVIFLSALKYHVFPVKWTNFYRPLWLLSSVLNSLYSFYWDVTRDWDLRYVKWCMLPFDSAIECLLPIYLDDTILASSYDFICGFLESFSCASGFTRIFKFSRPNLLSNLLLGRKWVRTCFKFMHIFHKATDLSNSAITKRPTRFECLLLSIRSKQDSASGANWKHWADQKNNF